MADRGKNRAKQSAGRRALKRSSVQATARACRARVIEHAWMSAAVAAVTLPAMAWAVDAGNATRMIEEINEAFGLPAQHTAGPKAHAPGQSPHWLGAMGQVAAGRWLSQRLAKRFLSMVWRRLPLRRTHGVLFFLGGQALAAGTAFISVYVLGMRHVAACVAQVEAAK